MSYCPEQAESAALPVVAMQTTTPWSTQVKFATMKKFQNVKIPY